MNLLFIDSYRRNFIEDSYGSGLGWENSTIFFYFSIIIVALIIGYIVDNKRKLPNNNRELKNYIIILGVILTCVLGLRGINVGKDTLNYMLSATEGITREEGGMEPGFMLVSRFLGLLFGGDHVPIFIFSALTVYFALAALWRDRNNINIFYAIGFFVGVYYFQALNLLRIYLAAAFLTYNFHYLVEGKARKYVYCVLFAALFHMSSLVMLLPVIFYKVYKIRPIIAIGSLVIAVLGVISIAAQFTDYLTMARYAHYGEVNDYEGGFGIMLLVDYLPGLYLMWYKKKYKIHGIWPDMLVSFTLVAVFIRSIAYYISIAGRLGIHFMVIYLILVPYFLNEMKINHRKEYRPFVVFLFVFLLFKIDMYFNGYLALDGIMPYNFLWNE